MDSNMLIVSAQVSDLAINTSLKQHDASLSPSPMLTTSSALSISPCVSGSFSSKLSDKLKLISPTYRRNNFRIEGHRGFGRYEPENTYQAFTHAVDAKLDGIELDVWLTTDQVPVIIHTAEGIVTFDDGTKKVVTEMSYEEIRSKKILANNVIPSLEEILRLTRRKICVNVEFKGTDLNGAEIVLAMIQEEEMLGQVQFSSFNWRFYDALTAAAQKLEITDRIYFGFLAEEPEVIDETIFKGQAGDAVTFPYSLLVTDRRLMLNMIDLAKEKGYNVKIYFSFKTPETFEIYQELEKLGIETVITNEPFLSKRYFQMESSLIGAA